MQQRMFWVLLVLALSLGLIITWVDSRPTWDDTGITAGMVLLVSAMLGLALPGRAWLWALAVGSWIPLLGILVTQNYGTVLALVIAFVGAYLGVFARKALAVLLRMGANCSGYAGVDGQNNLKKINKESYGNRDR